MARLVGFVRVDLVERTVDVGVIVMVGRHSAELHRSRSWLPHVISFVFEYHDARIDQYSHHEKFVKDAKPTVAHL